MEVPEDVEYIIGNLPFQLSSDILERVAELQLPAAFIVQDELADKVVASPGESEFNFFSFKMSYYFIPVKAGEISSRNYYPEPEVDTAVLKLFPEKYSDLDEEEEFLDFAKALFTHRRKKVRNAVVDARNILEEEKDVLKEFRDELPHSEKKVYELEVIEMQEVFQRFQGFTASD
jgi:16S rRNA (adenine1518-N6/adenine1519-N6)-dimethyltransferase